MVVAPLLPLLSCSKESEKPTAPKATEHDVRVYFSGDNLTGLGAYITAGSTDATGGDSLISYSANVSAATLSDFSPVLKVPVSRAYYATIALKNIKSGTLVPATTFLKADIIIDGQASSSVVLDRTTRPAAGTYLVRSIAIKPTDWQ